MLFFVVRRRRRQPLIITILTVIFCLPLLLFIRSFRFSGLLRKIIFFNVVLAADEFYISYKENRKKITCKILCAFRCMCQSNADSF